MTATRELSEQPGGLDMLVRAALPMIPGASRLPFVAGSGGEVPDTALGLTAARLDADRLATYARVCGFRDCDTLPATAPHLLVFPLHMALMTEGSFPIAPIGLVHLTNKIALHRTIGVDEPLDLRVHSTPLQPHPKGRTFTLVSEARVAEELVWEEHSTMLRRGGEGEHRGEGVEHREEPVRPARGGPFEASVEWRLPEDLGRRYGAVSGDRNPIHVHALAARLFGFPRAIAHGMWTKARCLAELAGSLGEAYTVEAAFRKPIFLPGRVSFAYGREGAATCFSVRADGDESKIHLEGKVS
jgi:acyl dehydratase